MIGLTRYITAFLFIISFAFSNSTASFSGSVTNSETGALLPEANLSLLGTDLGTATSNEGYFVFSKIPAGSYIIEVSYLGFETVHKQIELTVGQKQKINLELTPITIELSSVDVSGQRRKPQKDIQLSKVRLNNLQLRSQPQVGESDLMRSLQSLPGVLTIDDFSSGLVIRGGNTDQNLIMLDGVTVYNPFHLFGLFSNFILDAVREVELYKGGFNAEYGGRLSAVLNVRSKEGNQKYFDARASFSLMSGLFTMEGPLDKGSYLIAGRKSYFDKVFKGSGYYFPYDFFDWQGHVFQNITENDRVSVSWYLGRDNLTIEDSNLSSNWGNRTISIAYRKLFNTRFLSRWYISSSKFYTNFGLEELTDEYTDELKVNTHFGFGGISGTSNDNSLEDATIGSDWTLFLPSRDQVRYGALLKRYLFYNQTMFAGRNIFLMRQSKTELAAYVKYRHWFGLRFMAEPGLRITKYDAKNEKWYGDPRLRVKYLVDEKSSLNFAAGVYHQFIGTVQDDYNPSIMDQWFAVDKSVDAGLAIQYIIGYDRYIGQKYHLQVESYYKDLMNMLTFIERRSAVDEPIKGERLIDFVKQADGYAFGLEIFLKKEIGRLSGWCAYTGSVSRKTIGDDEYFSNWDRTNVFHLVGSYHISANWELSMKWSYQTGQPHTPIIGYYKEIHPNSEKPVFRTVPGDRNMERYPDYRRTDLGLTRHLKFDNVRVDVFLQVINVFNQINIFRYFYFISGPDGIDNDGDSLIDENDELTPIRKSASTFPFLPSIGVSVEL